MDRKVVLSTLFLVLVTHALGQSCPCTLSNSTRYTGTYKWDCTKKGLVDFPSTCFTQQSTDVSELVLSYNGIQTVRSTSLIDLTDLRVLFMDNNAISFVDRTAFEFLRKLEVLDVNHNLLLQFDDVTFNGLDLLNYITTIGTNLQAIPDLTGLTELVWLDFRSSQLTSLPMTGLFDPMLNSSIQFNVHGNEITDVAATTVLEIPDGSTVIFDNDVIVWAQDSAELSLLLSKDLSINLDLQQSAKICSSDGLPSDISLCAVEEL